MFFLRSRAYVRKISDWNRSQLCLWRSAARNVSDIWVWYKAFFIFKGRIIWLLKPWHNKKGRIFVWDAQKWVVLFYFIIYIIIISYYCFIVNHQFQIRMKDCFKKLPKLIQRISDKGQEEENKHLSLENRSLLKEPERSN